MKKNVKIRLRFLSSHYRHIKFVRVAYAFNILQHVPTIAPIHFNLIYIINLYIVDLYINIYY